MASPPSSNSSKPSGRGSPIRPHARYDAWQRVRSEEDGHSENGSEENGRTVLHIDTAKSVLHRVDSPDIPFGQSLNPYRGCEHGCAYCFARPTHAYLGLSPGLDFETQLFYKPDAVERLNVELAHPKYICQPIALGINTDAYQPIERRLGLTRAILEVLMRTRHPVSIVTKGALIERDVDLLADLARDELVQVMFSITTLDKDLARRMEPRASTPERRLQAMQVLAQRGIPVGVLFAPLIPALNDHEMESVLQAAQARGAESAAYVFLRLPHELTEIFPEWLRRNVPDRAEHVMSIIRQSRGGKDYDSRFGTRMRGEGVFADLYSKRFKLACRRLSLNRTRHQLNTAVFVPPRPTSPQLSLF